MALRLLKRRRKKNRGELPPLHLHTANSLGDGYGTSSAWIESFKKRKIKRAFITDHGVLSAIPKFYLDCKKEGIQILGGMEAYVLVDGYDGDRDEDGKVTRHKYRHLTLLAKNEIGWHNLIKLNNMSWRKGRFRGRGRISLDDVLEHSDGLYCLTACISGILSEPVQKYWLGEGEHESEIEVDEEVTNLARRLKHAFGRRLFIEIMLFDAKIQRHVNSYMVGLAERLNIEMVITNDCHYPAPEFNEAREILREFRYKSTSSATNRDNDQDNAGKDFSRPEFYPRTVAEVKLAWSRDGHKRYLTAEALERAIKNTYRIAYASNFSMDASLKLPVFNVRRHARWKFASKQKLATMGGSRKELLFMTIIADGYKKWFGKKFPSIAWRKVIESGGKSSNKYLRQLYVEYKVIHEAGFIDYFLIVEDLVRYCMDNNTLYGQGRGSVAGSLVAYLMRITRDDPLQYGLYFERFLNPGRVSELPDIDCDFEPHFRNPIKAYLAEVYGADHVVSIGTVGVVKIKSLIQKAASAHDFLIDGAQYDFHQIQSITNSIPTSIAGGVQIKTLEDAVSVCSKRSGSPFMEFYGKHQAWLERMEAMFHQHPVSVGRHAAGFIIAPESVDTTIPIRIQDDDGEERVIAQWRDKDLLPLGYLKMDILGLSTLSQIRYAQELIKKGHGITVPSLEDTDPETDKDANTVIRKVFATAKTDGVFQFNSGMFSRYMKDLEPRTYSDLFSTTALLRPGPMGIDAHKAFVELRHNRQVPHYDHELEKPILGPTGGLVIFQEQAMALCVGLAGFTLEEADTFRSVVGKKKLDKMPAQRKKFISGCVDRGISEKTAVTIFAKIESFAGYGFNKAHAVAYTGISYYQAWLRCFFPIEYWCSKFQFASGDMKHKESAWKLRFRAMASGIKFAKISVRNAGDKITINKKKKVVWKLNLIKGVGDETAALIPVLRKKYRKGIADPAELVKLAKKTWKSMREADPSTKKNCPIGKRAIIALICAGAFDDVDKDKTRKDILRGYLRSYYGPRRWQQMSTAIENEDADNLPKSMQTDYGLLFKMGTATGRMGLQLEYLRYLDAPIYRMFANAGVTSRTITKIPIGKIVTAYGIVSDLKCKNNNTLGIVTLAEYDGDINLVIFQKTISGKMISNIRKYQKESTIVKVVGKVAFDKFNGGRQLIVSSISEAEEDEKKDTAKKQKLVKHY